MQNVKQQNVEQHNCPNCGASLQYDPSSGKLVCLHCGSSIDFEKSNAVEERDFTELATFSHWKDSDVASYRCFNCGAVTIAPRTALSRKCPYCSSPVVIEDVSGSLVRPDSLVPFELSVEEAAFQLADWRKKKHFAPNKFRKKPKADSINGVFVPAWTFDAVTVSDYNGSVGYRRTRTVRRNGKTYTESYIDWHRVRGVINQSFNDLFVRANENISNSYFNKLQPFPMSKYRVYSDEYLAGYIADSYSVQPLDAFERAKSTMLQAINRAIVARYNADVVGDMDVDMRILSRSFKYMMLPVYIAATKYNKKVYNQYVSGVYYAQNRCKVCGASPVSPWKVLATVLACAAALAGIIYLVWRSKQGGGGDEWSLLSTIKSVFSRA